MEPTRPGLHDLVGLISCPRLKLYVSVTDISYQPRATLLKKVHGEIEQVILTTGFDAGNLGDSLMAVSKHLIRSDTLPRLTSTVRTKRIVE